MSTSRSHTLLRLLLGRQPGGALAPGRRSSSLAGGACTSMRLPDDGRTLSDFLPAAPGRWPADAAQAHAEAAWADGPAPRFHIATYGCQMNVNDSEVVAAILAQHGMAPEHSEAAADVVLLNTCAIRENAEARIWRRLAQLRDVKRRRREEAPDKAPLVVGVLGCMAERLKERLLDSEQLADLVVGPDAYRQLPRILDALTGRAREGGPPAAPGAAPAHHQQQQQQQRQSEGRREGAEAATGRAPDDAERTAPSDAASHPVAEAGEPGPAVDPVAVQLSLEETYADISPLRPAGRVGAYLSIMRGCNNMCSFCIVPRTRGRERSRPAASILREVEGLARQGCREVTLLGQNVNSYADGSPGAWPALQPLLTAGAAAGGAAAAGGSDAAVAAGGDPFARFYAPGFRSVYKPTGREGAARFGHLLAAVAVLDPEMRVRFTSPHPKDFSDEVLEAIAAHPNVCNQLHMPAQSGSSSVLERMRRGYSAAAYLALVDRVRAALPGVALTTDLITGFCGETEAEHADTLELVRRVRFDNAYIFAYSLREKTHAARHYADDVPPEVKRGRLGELMTAFQEGQRARLAAEVGSVALVLVEGPSRKGGEAQLAGKTDKGHKLVFERLGAGLADGLGAAWRGVGPPAGSGVAAGAGLVPLAAGDYVAVLVTALSERGSTLLGLPLARTGVREFAGVFGGATCPAGSAPAQAWAAAVARERHAAVPAQWRQQATAVAADGSM